MRLYFTLVLLLLLSSCKDAFMYNVNEVRFNEDERNLNEKNIRKIQSQPVSDTLRFILIGDSQRFYEEAEDFVAQANGLRNIAFVLLAGDITDFGLNKEYRWINDRLKKLKMPYIGVIGNHDMLANGRAVYKEMFGPENFSFDVHNSRFICINTNSLEVGHNGSLPDLPWLRQQLHGEAGFQNAFVISHIPPFDNGFDKKLEKEYHQLLLSNPRTRISMHGHRHRWELLQPYNDRLEYLVVGSMNKRNYALITVWNDQYKIEEIYY